MFSSYAALWSMLGAFGLSYLGVAIFEPSWLGDLTPSSAHAERERAETESAVMKLTADVDGIKSSMTKLQLDVSSVKSDVAAQGQQTQTLGSQLTALEDKIRLGQTPVAAAAPAGQTGTDDIALGAPEADAVQKPETRIINAAADKSHSIVTGSVDKRPEAAKAKSKSAGASDGTISFGPAVVKRAAAKPIGIEIASNSTVAGLRSSWSELAAQHHDKLSKLKARYTTNGDPVNPNFNLVAGPIRTKAEAERLCKDLQAQAVSCAVGDFTGNAL
jgi:hypothetical protein